MGLPRTVCTEILYILAGHPPLQLPLAHMLVCYVASLSPPGEVWLVSRVAAWAQGLDLQTYHRRLSVCSAADFVACFPSFVAMGDMVLHSVRTRLAESDRLVGRGLLQVWQDLASLALGRGQRRLQVPEAWGTAHSLRTVCPTFHFAWSRTRQRYSVVCPQATWL